MFAYCLNNPVAFFDPSGLCTYIGYQPWLSPNGQYIDCGQINCPQSSNYKGNYFIHDVDDISHTTKKKHKNVSKEDAVDYYNKIAAGDYSATSGSSSAIAGSVVPPLISILIGLFSDLAGASNNRITDPQGRMLYIEEGYTVETIERQYWDMDYCASDIEYFIYDQDDNLVFNDVIGLTYFPDEHG